MDYYTTLYNSIDEYRKLNSYTLREILAHAETTAAVVRTILALRAADLDTQGVAK